MKQPIPSVSAVPAAASEVQEELGFSALLDLSIKLNNRIDTLWQRVIYAHGAMVGVLVFLASAQYPFTIPRLLVVFFYTMNSMVTYVAFRDAYDGLRAVAADLAEVADHKSRVYAWAKQQNYELHALRRAGILIVLWAIITYLVLAPLFTYWKVI